MTLKADLRARKDIGIQKQAMVVETIGLPETQLTGINENALKKWAGIQARLLLAAEAGIQIMRFSILPNFLYHSPSSKAFVDELVRLAQAEELAAVVVEAPNDKGTKELFLEFDLSGV